MAIWLVIIGTVLSVFAVGLLYISFRAARFPAVLRLAHGKKSLARLLCLGFFTAATALLWATLNLVNAVVCLLHLVAFWMVCDLISFLITKIRKRQPKRYWAGAAAMVLCALWLAGGWVADHHVWIKTYSFETPKLSQSMRLVQITDAHIGATFHADGFLKHIETVNALGPDAVVITGSTSSSATTTRAITATWAGAGPGRSCGRPCRKTA